MPKKGSTRVLHSVETLGNDHPVRIDVTGRFWWADENLDDMWGYVVPEGQPSVRLWLPLGFKVGVLPATP